MRVKLGLLLDKSILSFLIESITSSLIESFNYITLSLLIKVRGVFSTIGELLDTPSSLINISRVIKEGILIDSVLVLLILKSLI